MEIMVLTQFSPPGFSKTSVGVLNNSLGGTGHLVGKFIDLDGRTGNPYPVLSESSMDLVHPFVSIAFDYPAFIVKLRPSGHLLGILA